MFPTWCLTTDTTKSMRHTATAETDTCLKTRQPQEERSEETGRQVKSMFSLQFRNEQEKSSELMIKTSLLMWATRWDAPQAQSVQFFPKRRDGQKDRWGGGGWGGGRQTDILTHRQLDRQTNIPAVDGGVGEEGQVGGELAPEPEEKNRTALVETSDLQYTMKTFLSRQHLMCLTWITQIQVRHANCDLTG